MALGAITAMQEISGTIHEFQAERADGGTIEGDVLVLAAGTQPNFFRTPGADEFAFPLYSVADAERVRKQMLQLFHDAAAKPELVDTPSQSGKGQEIARCPKCRIAVWSHYAGAGPLLSFVRVGTLDDPDRLPPDIHIFTASKQPWVMIPPGMPSVPSTIFTCFASARLNVSLPIGKPFSR